MSLVGRRARRPMPEEMAARPRLGQVRLRRPGWLNSAVSLALQVVIFGLFGMVLVLVEADHTTRSLEFTDTPRFSVWATIIAAMTATWPILFRVGRDRLREIAPYVMQRRAGAEATRIAALSLVVAAFWLAQQQGGDRPDHILWGHSVRMGIATAGGLIAAVPCLLTMWRVHDALAPEVTNRESALDMMRRLVALRGPYTVVLTAVGVLVTEATLASGALRNALIQWKPTTATAFPAESVLLYGGFFTLLLAAAAVPTYRRLQGRAMAVVEELFPSLDPSDDVEWQKRLKERQDLAGFVQADSGLMKTFQATVLISGPLLTGLISLLIPTRG